MLQKLFIYFIFFEFKIFSQAESEKIDNSARYSELAGILVFVIVAILLILLLYLSQIKFEKPEGVYVYKRKIKGGRNKSAELRGTVVPMFNILFFTLIFIVLLYAIELIMLLVQ